MMHTYFKIFAGIVVVMAMAIGAYAQPSLDLHEYNEKSLRYNKTASIVLGGWAVGNIASSAIMVGRSSGQEKYFYQFNAYWNVVNLGLAGFTYYVSYRDDPSSYSLSESIDRQKKIEKTLLLNTGLDVAYVATGFYLIERSKNIDNNSEMFEGFGKSLILQGGFLFIFDIALHFAHNTNSKRLKPILNNMSASKKGIGFIYHF